MKKRLLAVCAVATLISAPAFADAAKGQKLYQKKLKELCGKSGAVFAATHTQDEWQEAKDEGKLTEIMTGSCEAGKSFFEGEKFESKYQTHIFDFVYNYASDSGNVPSC